MSVNHSARSGGIIVQLSDFLQHEGVLCRLIEAILMRTCTHNIPFLNRIKNTLNYPESAAVGFFPRDPRTSSNSRGKPAISVRAT